MNTCDKCKHYSFSSLNYVEYVFAGKCSKAGDSNSDPCPENGVVGVYCEGYFAGVYVGPKFGCIHWEAKDE